MTSPLRKLAFAAPLAAAVLAAAGLAGQAEARGHSHSSAAAIGYAPAAWRVIAQARTASGGAGWNLLRGWHETGREGQAPYEAWLDPLRYGLRVEVREPAGLRVHGFNGQGEWRIEPGGAVNGGGEAAAVARARTEAFFAIGGYFFPSRFEAHGAWMGVRRSGGRAYDVVQVQPWGGTTRELWFDHASHLLGRMVERTGPQPAVIELADYRKVGPVRIAFRKTFRGPDGAERVRQLDVVSFAPADRALFSLPRTAPAAP
jgi:hypothetical protein